MRRKEEGRERWKENAEFVRVYVRVVGSLFARPWKERKKKKTRDTKLKEELSVCIYTYIYVGI